MLRSGARSAELRAVAHAITAGCVALFAYLSLWVVVAATSRAVDGQMALAAAALVVPVAAAGSTVAVAVHAKRRARAGGYVLLCGASLISSFLCVAALTPLVTT